MTDKVQKIREKVEKRYEYWREKELNLHSTESEIRMSECKHFLSLLDSLQEECVSNPTPNERMSKERFAEACKAACCDRNYRSCNGHTETRDDYFVDGVQWADEHPIKEPVSEDLKEAIDTYLATYWGGEKEKQNWPFLKKMAIHFAEWQKEQLMTKAIDGEVGYWNLRGLSINTDLPRSVSEGDVVKIIVIKQE